MPFNQSDLKNYGGFMESHFGDLLYSPPCSPLLSFIPIVSYADASLKNCPVDCYLGYYNDIIRHLGDK
jgi:hypothetical protein